MKYEVELKVVNDEFNRFPDNTVLKIALDNYIKGFKGAVVFHDSLYDYNYDTEYNKYYDVDKLNIVGHIFEITELGGKIFLRMELSNELDLDDRFICFFRSTMQNFETNGTKFNNVVIHAVDLVKILTNEDVTETNISHIVKI